MDDLVVIKIGGNTTVNPEFFLEEFQSLNSKFVIVHGHSAMASEYCSRAGIVPEYITSPSGFSSRFTDESTLDVIAQASMQVNTNFVERINPDLSPLGAMAGEVGIIAKAKTVLREVVDGKTRFRRGNRSGRVESFDSSRLISMLNDGLTPVISPIGHDADGALVSLDGDRCAAAIASGLGASRLIILSSVDGVYRDFFDKSTLIEQINLQEMDETEEWINDGMKRKVLAAKEALKGGVESVVLATANRATPVHFALQGQGTRVVM